MSVLFINVGMKVQGTQEFLKCEGKLSGTINVCSIQNKAHKMLLNLSGSVFKTCILLCLFLILLNQFV